jgi:hypothetical protein
MIFYASRSGKQNGATAFEIGHDFIVVEMQKKRKYKYTYSSAGEEKVEAMKQCAIGQSGLTSYIHRNNPSYEVKF